MKNLSEQDTAGMEKKEVSLEEGFQMAVQLHQGGRLSEAKALYTSILEVMPDHPETLHFYGLLMHHLGDSQEAIGHIQRALIGKPDYADAINNLGNIYRALHQTERAEEAYRKVTELIPEHPGALNNLAAIYSDQGRLALARETYAAAAQAAPDNADVRFNLGNAFSREAKWEAAAQAYRQAIELDPDHPAAHRGLGKALTELEQNEEALTVLQRAAELNADHAATHCELGHSLQIKGLAEDALAAYRRAIFLKSDYSDAYEQAAGILYKLDRMQEAQALVRQWLRAMPDSPTAQHRAAAILKENVPERASNEYVRELFDMFSDVFDQQLEVLQYAAPRLLAERLTEIGLLANGQLDVLDAGCGTGLCGPLLRPFAKRLLGVDLSSGMLENARQRGDYDELSEMELTAYLQQHPDNFDLIVSADTLVYFGPLEDVLLAAASSLRDQGRLAFSVEQGAADVDHAIGLHGRYSHSEDYLRRTLRQAEFSDVEIITAVLRIESRQPVAGWLVTATKRNPPS